MRTIGSQDAALLELHDATMESVELGRGGRCEVHLGEASAFVAVGFERYEVWSSCFTLMFEGVTFLRCDGLIRPDDRVTDGTILDATAELDLPLRRQPEGDVRFSVLLAGSGTRIDLTAGSLSVSDPVLHRKLEDWEGPLYGE